MKYRIRVTVVGKQWGNLKWDDPMKKLYVVEQKVFGLFWLKVSTTCSEFSARRELEKLRQRNEKVVSTVKFEDYILEDDQ